MTLQLHGMRSQYRKLLGITVTKHKYYISSNNLVYYPAGETYLLFQCDMLTDRILCTNVNELIKNIVILIFNNVYSNIRLSILWDYLRFLYIVDLRSFTIMQRFSILPDVNKNLICDFKNVFLLNVIHHIYSPFTIYGT